MKPTLYPLKNYSSPNGYHISKDKLDEPWYDMHSHDSVEITLLLSGTCKQSLNGSEYFLPTYSYFIMSKQDSHRFYDYSPNALLYNLMILPSLLPKSTVKFLESMQTDKICNLPEDVGKTVIALMDALSFLQNCSFSNVAKLTTSLFQNLIDIFLYHYSDRPKSKSVASENIIQNALIYINANYTKSITLNDIANQANCNPTYLSEVFHKKMDVTIKQYILQLRVKYAKQLLTHSNTPIMNICYECGFSSLASFNRNFLEQEGVSPSSYRKSYNIKHSSPN